MSVETLSPQTTTRPRVAMMVLFVILVMSAAAGGAVAGVRLLGTSVTAEARLVVGDQSVRAQSVPGYALATQQLAATYSRLIGSSDTTDPVGGQGAISASPIPDSAIIRVQARAESDAVAIQAADAAAQQLIATANRARNQEEDAASTTAYLRERAALRAAQARVAAATASPAAARGAAADQVELAQVRVNAAAESLRDDLRASLSNSAGVTVVQKAAVTTTAAPRAALLGGFAGGVGMALLIASGYVLRHALRR